jgi:hypothetical protein
MGGTIRATLAHRNGKDPARGGSRYPSEHYPAAQIVLPPGQGGAGWLPSGNVRRPAAVLIIGDLLVIGGVVRTLPPRHRSLTSRGPSSSSTNELSDCWSYGPAIASPWPAASITSAGERHTAATVSTCWVFHNAWDGVSKGEVVVQPGGRQRPVCGGGVGHQSQGAVLTRSQLTRLEQHGQPSRSQQ